MIAITARNRAGGTVAALRLRWSKRDSRWIGAMTLGRRRYLMSCDAFG